MLALLLYLVNLFRTVLVIVLIVVVIRFFRKLFAPQQTTTNKTTENKRKEGETTIRFNRKGKKIINKDEGEYIDFEEVD